MCGLLIFGMLPWLSSWHPCGHFELDGQPGYGSGDLLAAISLWAGQGADHDGDGRTDVKDFVRQLNCVPGLSHGLLGSYYGFEDGSGQAISFPDFDALPDPVAIRATETLLRDSGYRGFLDSDLISNFAALFEGYLWVPEEASYSFRLQAQFGARLYLGDSLTTPVLEVEGWSAQADTAPMPLTCGLHPIRVEYYTHYAAGRIGLSWWSSGSVIGPNPRIIDVDHLFHAGLEVPEHAVTDVEIRFSPETGQSTTSAQGDWVAWIMSPNSGLHLALDGQEQTLRDGRFASIVELQPGLNQFEFQAWDDAGRTARRTYSIYRDGEPISGPGLAANLYAREWYWAPVPCVEAFSPFALDVASGIQLNGDQIGQTYVSRGVIAVLKGVLDAPETGWYSFGLDSSGMIAVNGTVVAAIRYDHARQWDSYGSVFLEAGRHHIQLLHANPWQEPECQIYWAFEDGDWSLMPDHVFSHGPNHFDAELARAPTGTRTRVTEGLMMEFLFLADEERLDSSGYGFHLWPDPRATFREPAGVTWTGPGGLVTEQGAIHAVANIKANQSLTLEAEFTWEGAAPDDWSWRPIVSLTHSNWGSYARLAIQHDRLLAVIHDDQDSGLDAEIIVDDFLQIHAGTRTHMALTWNGNQMRLFIDGTEVDAASTQVRVQRWGNLAHFNVAQPLNRYERDVWLYDTGFHGTVHVAAVYDRALSAAEVNTNRVANPVLSPDPDPSTGDVLVFPPAGTTPEQLDLAHHVLNRLSFGPCPTCLNHVIDQGVDTWLQEQLDPISLDDAQLNEIIQSPRFDPVHHGLDFTAIMLYRNIRSSRQTLEVMTQFWENHFNTQASKVEELRAELAENEAFRTHALGRFGDLLTTSATSPAMMIYLDNEISSVGAPNENYARELLELHALGANNGYQQEDIVAAARCFTGWTVRDGEFYFDAGMHDYGEKVLPTLGLAIPAGGGLSDGMMVLAHLAGRPECAEFIAFKLCQLLVADDPPADVLNAAQTRFQQTDGDIREVLLAITSHDRFRNDLNYRMNKFKTPLEFICSALRCTQTRCFPQTLYSYLEGMGMPLFDYAIPTGFDETPDPWLNSRGVLERWNFIDDLTSNRGTAQGSWIDLWDMTRTFDLESAESISQHFLVLTTHGFEHADIPQDLLWFLTRGDPAGFQLTPLTLDQELRHTLSLALRLPEFNLQ